MNSSYTMYIVEVVEEEHGESFQSLHLRNVEDGTAWVLINVYGPVQDDRKVIFLQELLDRIKRTQLPLIVRWDFNLIRKLEDKSSGNVDHRFMDAFNDMVEEAELRELRRGGSRYTWTNKQVNPVQSVLDRVFVNNSWEDFFHW